MHRSIAVLTCCIFGSINVLGDGPGFQPGHIFITEWGFKGCREQHEWIRQIDPETGESWIFADAGDDLCITSGLRFTPDRARLRVIIGDRLLDFDPQGNAVEVLGQDDGLIDPYLRSGPVWDRNGNMYVSGVTMHTWCFPADGRPGRRLSNANAGALAMHPNELLYASGGRYLGTISSDGIVSIIDDYGSGTLGYCLIIGRAGDLFVVVEMSSTGGATTLFRYDGADPATRRVLTSGFQILYESALTLSPDETQIYLATYSRVWAIDADDGNTSVLLNLPSGRYGGRGIAVYTPPRPGDMNCDGWVNNFDIDAFVLALTDPAAYSTQYVFCDRTRADMNADGAINSFDIDGFVEAVVGGVQE